MAKGDRGRRGRSEYGGGDHQRGSSRRGRGGGFGSGSDRNKDRETPEQERERYESASEASDPDKGHSEAGGVKEYGSQADADRGERSRRDREKRERAERKRGMREQMRRAKAADRASGGMGGTTEYGRAITDEEIDRQLEADALDRAAEEAWNAGDYGSWLGNKMASTAKGFMNDVATEYNDFVDAPLDYAADVARNPFLGTAVAMFSPAGAVGLAGVKVADTITDYFQDEVTGKEAIQQGALDIAGSIQNQGLATMANFIGDPTGTTGKQVGAGIGQMASGLGLTGAALSVMAPSVVTGVLNKAAEEDKSLSPKEKREVREAAKKRREEAKAGKDDRKQVAASGAFSGSGSGGGGSQTYSSRGSIYSPAQDWQVSTMDMFGLENLPTVTPSISTKDLTSDKIDTKAGKALNLIEQYPWMFDQGILSSGKNPYAVTQ